MRKDPSQTLVMHEYVLDFSVETFLCFSVLVKSHHELVRNLKLYQVNMDYS